MIYLDYGGVSMKAHAGSVLAFFGMWLQVNVKYDVGNF